MAPTSPPTTRMPTVVQAAAPVWGTTWWETHFCSSSNDSNDSNAFVILLVRRVVFLAISAKGPGATTTQRALIETRAVAALMETQPMLRQLPHSLRRCCCPLMETLVRTRVTALPAMGTHFAVHLLQVRQLVLQTVEMVGRGDVRQPLGMQTTTTTTTATRPVEDEVHAHFKVPNADPPPFASIELASSSARPSASFELIKHKFIRISIEGEASRPGVWCVVRSYYECCCVFPPPKHSLSSRHRLVRQSAKSWMQTQPRVHTRSD